MSESRANNKASGKEGKDGKKDKEKEKETTTENDTKGKTKQQKKGDKKKREKEDKKKKGRHMEKHGLGKEDEAAAAALVSTMEGAKKGGAAKKARGAKLSDEQLEKLQALAYLFYDAQYTLDEHTNKLAETDDIIAEVNVAVNDLKKSLDSCQLVWKIDCFAQRFQEAEEGKKTVIYSPTFFTDKHGYKIALSLCPYGDSKAKGEYMSMFFCILLGPYDALNVWPFFNALEFSLLDQTEDPHSRHHLSNTFYPSSNKKFLPYLNRPTKSRNPSLGIPKFVSFDSLYHGPYVKEDCIYIRVKVIDYDDMMEFPADTVSNVETVDSRVTSSLA